MLLVQVAADFELDVLALAERAEEEEQQVEEKYFSYISFH